MSILDYAALEHLDLTVTEEHRHLAAIVFLKTYDESNFWVKNGFGHIEDKDDLTNLARAFALFEQELLACPVTIVQSLEDSEVICTLCGTSGDDSHTIRDCFTRYKAAEDDAHKQVTDYLSTRNTELETELAEVKQGYERLDANWSQLHDLGIDTFRAALEMPEATIPEMVEAIARLRHPATEEPLAVFWDDDSVYVVARSAEDATLVYAEHVGYCMSHETLQFSRFSDSDSIRIKCYGLDHPASGRIAPVDEAGPHIVLVTRPAIEWAHRIGRGFLCTTDY